MRTAFNFILFFFLLSCSVFAETQRDEVVPQQGFVSDEKTALTIAYAIWLPIFKNNLLEPQAFKAILTGDVWLVTQRDHVRGCAPEAEISRKDGRILRVSKWRCR